MRRASGKTSVAPQRRRAQSNLLSDLRFRMLIRDADWAALPPSIRRRFTQRLAGGNTIVYSGEVTETQLSRAGWWLAQALRVIGAPLPLCTDPRVPSAVTVTEDMAGGGQVWTRLYARRSGFPQIIFSAKRFAGPTGLEEYVGYGVGVALNVHVRNGVLVFESERYFLKVLGFRLRLPHWLTPGRLSVTHAELTDGEFRYTLELIHPRLGMLVQQVAWFRETEQWTPPSC